MKYEKSLSLLIFGITVLLSAAAYASEDHISIKPVGVTQPGMYEITLFGERNSDYANVTSFKYDILNMRGYGGGLTLRLYAVIAEGVNPGKSQYEAKVKLYLEPGGWYGVSLWLTDDESDPDKYYINVSDDINLNEYSKFVVPHISAVPVSIEKVGAEISDQDSFTLRNVIVPGYDDTYWGLFQWNPASLSFELRDAGKE